MDPQDRFTALYRAHHGAVLRYANRRTDPEPARDVVAETFLVAWRRMAEVPAEPAEALPWLYGVARRVLANSDRARRRSEHLAMRLLHQGAGPGPAPDLADALTERARLRQALECLPEADQEALRLIGWEELDLAGAAAAMGCSRSTMAVRLHRARRRMMRALRAIEQLDTPPAAALASARPEQEIT